MRQPPMKTGGTDEERREEYGQIGRPLLELPYAQACQTEHKPYVTFCAVDFESRRAQHYKPEAATEQYGVCCMPQRPRLEFMPS